MSFGTRTHLHLICIYYNALEYFNQICKGVCMQSKVLCSLHSMLYIIPVFAWSCTFAVVFLQSFVQPFVSVLTFFKGSLLIATVSIDVSGTVLHCTPALLNQTLDLGTHYLFSLFSDDVSFCQVGAAMYVGSTVGNEILSDFKYVGEPFLMGTVAMGMYICDCMMLSVGCWQIVSCLDCFLNYYQLYFTENTWLVKLIKQY